MEPTSRATFAAMPADNGNGRPPGFLDRATGRPMTAHARPISSVPVSAAGQAAHSTLSYRYVDRLHLPGRDFARLTGSGDEFSALMRIGENPPGTVRSHRPPLVAKTRVAR